MDEDAAMSKMSKRNLERMIQLNLTKERGFGKSDVLTLEDLE